MTSRKENQRSVPDFHLQKHTLLGTSKDQQDRQKDETEDFCHSTPPHPQHKEVSDDTTLMAESEEELKSLLMKVKEENKKAGLKKT